MSDKIIFRGSRKDWEAIPRELLQRNDLSLSAMGLICAIKSYPDNWVVIKKDLYTRFADGRRKVESSWDELVAKQYILQFRKRIGKNFVFQYIFDVIPFDKEETQKIIMEMEHEGFSFYHKDMVAKERAGEAVIPNDYLFCEGSDSIIFSNVQNVHQKSMGSTFWDAQNVHQKKSHNTSVSSNVHFEHPILNSTKRTHIKENNNNNNNTFISYATESEIQIKEDLKMVFDYLVNHGVPQSEVEKVMGLLKDKSYTISYDGIVNQYKYCYEKAQRGELTNFAKYFVGGLQEKSELSYLVAPEITTKENSTIFNLPSMPSNVEMYKDISIPEWTD